MKWVQAKVKLDKRRNVIAFLLYHSSNHEWAIRAPYRHSQYTPHDKWVVAFHGSYDLLRAPSLVIAARAIKRLHKLRASDLIKDMHCVSLTAMIEICRNLEDLPVLICLGADTYLPVKLAIKHCQFLEHEDRLNAKIAATEKGQVVAEAIGWSGGAIYVN